MLTEPELQRLVARIAEEVRPERIVVFGSYAKGAASTSSDLDILVVMDTNLPVPKRAALLRPVVDGYLIPIDLHVYTPEEVADLGRVEHSFMASALRYGRTVYGR